MSVSSFSRPRRALTVLVTTALVALGLVAVGAGVSPAAAVDPSVVVTSTPSPATPGAENTFAVAVTNHDTGAIKSLRIVLPSGFSVINNVVLSPALNWGAPQINQTTRAIDVAVTNNAAQLQDGDSLTITFKATAPAAGSPTLSVLTWSNANQSGPGLAATGGTVSIGKLNQTISFTSTVPSGPVFNGSYNATATATSGLSVTFSTDTSAVCTVSSTGSVSFVGVGTCHVNADQSGSSTYNAAAQVQQSFAVGKADQTVSITPVGQQTFSAGATVDVSASASSGLPVTLSISSGPCSVSGTTITLTGAGVCQFAGDQAGNTNYNPATQATSQFTIGRGAATMVLTTGTFTYDGTAHAATVTTTPDGLSGVEITYDSATTDPTTTAPTDAGSYDVTATLTNNDYEADPQYGTLVIDPKPITGSFTADGKTYDGSTAATILGCTLPDENAGGVLDADASDVVIDCGDAVAVFGSKNAGNRTVSLTGAELTGTRAGNYSLTGVADTTAVIEQATVTASIDAGSKTYDCTTDVDLVNGIEAHLSGVIDGDVDVQIDSASFDSASVGPGRTVTAQVSLTGTAADVANYVLASDTAADTADINPRPLVGGFTAQDKEYDGTDTATVVPDALSGVVCDEDVRLEVGAPHFADKNVGPGKTVTGGLSLVGDDAGNYVLDITSSNTSSADITAKALNVTFTANDKVFDTTSTATVKSLTLGGKVSGDDLSLTGGSLNFMNDQSPSVATPAVGSWFVVWSGFTLGGADIGNYAFTATSLTSSARAAITPLYSGRGFYAPVDMPNPGIVWNTVKGGQTVPLKFDVFNAAGTVEQTSLEVFGSDPTKAFSAKQVTCDLNATNLDDIEVVSTGNTSLRYDSTAGQYIQNWKTPTTANTCYKVWVTTVDGTTVGPAYFKLKK